MIVATVHSHLARAVRAGSPRGRPRARGEAGGYLERRDRSPDRVCSAVRRLAVKVGFNHRFHPALARAAAEVSAERHGEFMHLRARYGHGGRRGYEREWRADPARSGGGELVDQGMHLLDLTHWLAGPLPLHAALLRTQFWGIPVEDNAALILGAGGTRSGPWAMLHVSWTEWKNLFSLEVYCRAAKLQVDGLAGSYGPQRLRIYRMGPELGPPLLEEHLYPEEDALMAWRVEALCDASHSRRWTAAVRRSARRALRLDADRGCVCAGSRVARCRSRAVGCHSDAGCDPRQSSGGGEMRRSSRDKPPTELPDGERESERPSRSRPAPASGDGAHIRSACSGCGTWGASPPPALPRLATRWLAWIPTGRWWPNLAAGTRRCSSRGLPS